MEFTYIQKKGTPRATTKNILQLKFLYFFLRVKTRNSSFMERPNSFSHACYLKLKPTISIHSLGKSKRAVWVQGQRRHKEDTK